MIHATAIVSSKAVLGDRVEIGPYAVVEDDVEIGSGSRIEAHAVIRDGARIGEMVTIGNHATISGLPQDLKFDPSTSTFARIGSGTTVREGATINRATRPGESTVIGEKCFIMAAAHVGHDCRVGSNVIIGNASLLGGFVTVGDCAFLGGSAGVHQFCRIGESVMFGGQSTTTTDVAPFTIFADRNALFGINLVGLRRRGFSKELIQSIQACYRRVFLAAGNLRETASELLQGEFGEARETRAFLEFFSSGNRGFARPGRKKT